MRQLLFIKPVLLLIVLTLPCSRCVHETSSCAFVPQSAAAGPLIPEGFGVNIDFTDPRAGEMKLLSEAGFRWVRIDLKWDATEQEPGKYDFAAYDRLMMALQPHNIHPLFILDYGNPLYDGGAPPRTEATREAFARWAVAAAKHFAGRGAIWEVYNEPNHSMFWPPKPNAQEYVDLALAVGRAFRTSVPEEKLIGPATSEIDFNFIEHCFKAGLLDYWSAVSIHPYRRNDPETAAEDYCRLRQLIKTYAGDRDVPIISSEWGYSAAWPSVNEQKQGELLARAWLTNVANGISLSIWYDWHDDGLDPNNPEHHFGTVSNVYHDNRDPVYDPKPAYLAAKALTTFLTGYRFESRIKVGSDADYVLAFRKDNELRYAAWTTANAGSRVMIPLSAGRYSTVSHVGLDLGSVKGDQKGLPITLANTPIYVRQNN
jgi:hypothetical protein